MRTSRLLLRSWREQDLPGFAARNADPRVMEFFPKVLDRTESDALAARIREHFDRHGFGLWAVEVTGVADFVGFVGLNQIRRRGRRGSRTTARFPLRLRVLSSSRNPAPFHRGIPAGFHPTNLA